MDTKDKVITAAAILSCGFIACVIVWQLVFLSGPSQGEARAAAEAYVVENDLIGGVIGLDDRAYSQGTHLTGKMWVVWEAIPFEEVRVGIEDGHDVVFHATRHMLVHRAVHRNEDGSLRTRGLGNTRNDRDLVTIENYRGVVVKVFPFH